MIQGILGKKLGMTQVFVADGRRIPVTVVEAGPCTVVQKKTESTDGYNALQVGFEAKKSHRVNKPMMGHFKKADQGAFAALRELAADNVDEYQVGDQVTCDSVFKAGDIVDVTGTSKGKGFQGVIKRWGFSGGRATHGSKFHRAPGSIGMSASPARVHRGKKMPGQMGNARVTQQNLEIVEVRADQNLILVKGAIPGPNQGLVLIRKCVKA
ncbi:MAG: 50S ribosomal protein L3 [Desulfuromonadales bacterium]|jgi:large subunit ribosomal protein L3|nr:50S ribosomal protein L3 [Deltaproteobacteria bacterium IMCC39524]MDH3807523.1 50S ribosomal protein L3 [Desulfuromonadales bacterium]MDH3867913.1 50S ribosomal protein L3 [Desulfuromonadales bacterium]MDH3960379.1 50S ribosomal protein L3 [Desulfuromonadales bacterium]MDH4024900.1 50S ribosomal protein L3 [Desulfuromonadales bacterium]